MTQAPQQPLPPPTDIEAAPRDTAGQSLADALRTSFKILKMGMVVLVVLFLASGTFVVEQNEQAVVLRLGTPVGDVRDAGFKFAFPAPVDEVIKLPVKQSSTVSVDSQWLSLKDSEKNVPLSQLMRGGEGLKPMKDGAVLTADRGLVHFKWRLTYRVDDLTKYVSLVSGTDIHKAEQIITRILESAAIHVVSRYTTEDATRKRLSEIRSEVKVEVNDRLEKLGTGIVVESVEPESTPPVQTIVAFSEVAREENNKRTTIANAERAVADALNSTAGDAYPKLISLFAQLDGATVAANAAEQDRVNAEIDRTVLENASGKVGGMIRDARGYYTTALQKMRADAEQYEILLAEYRERPELLKTRLWQEAKSRLLQSPGIVKVFRPAGTTFRIKLGLDPRQKSRQEQESYLKQMLPDKPPEMEIKIPGGPLTVP